MQLMPSLVTSTLDASAVVQSGKLSKRRLICLVATVSIASALGLVLGCTLRFRVFSLSQAPIFNPQQDFPPLSEWPPVTPQVDYDVDLDTSTSWDVEPSSQVLVYSAPLPRESEVPPYPYSSGIPEAVNEVVVLDAPAPETFNDEDVIPVSHDDSLTSEDLSITDDESLDHSSPKRIENSADSFSDRLLFDKQSVLESEHAPADFTPHLPVSITPEPNVLFD